jgi:uncharacterized protein YyaL (SSP411 family)
MNQLYVNIKVHTADSFYDTSLTYVAEQVDREERPDVDRLYMTFLQATSGGGGWPMSVC